MASAGWTPRWRATSATDGLGGRPCSVDPDALEVRRPGLGADPGPLPVVGVRRRRRRRAGAARDRPGSRSCSSTGRARRSRHAGMQVEGQPGLEREQHRDAPAVGLGDHPGPGGGRLVEEVEQVARRPGWPPARRSWAPRSSAASAFIRSRARRRTSGSGADMPASAPSKMPRPECSHHPHQRGHLVPRGQPRRHRPVVGGLVVLGARGGEADGPGLEGVGQLALHERPGRRRWPPPRRPARPWPRCAGPSARCWRRS